jgi:hypothetical protein
MSNTIKNNNKKIKKTVAKRRTSLVIWEIQKLVSATTTRALPPANV